MKLRDMGVCEVGDKVYSGETAADGLYDSLSSLKAPNMQDYQHLPTYL